MKILVANDYFGSLAGGFVAAYNLALECRFRGHEIVFLTTVQTKNEAGFFYHDDIPVYKIYTKYPLRLRGLFTIWNPFVFREFREIVQEIRPDIIHAHIIHLYLSHYILKLAHALRIPTVLTAHDVMTFCYTKLLCSLDGSARHKARFYKCLRCQRFRYVPFRNACLKHYINRYASKVICVSHALKAGLELNGIQNLQTVYNGIDPQRLVVEEKSVMSFKRKYSLQGKKILLHAGRLSAAKGSEYLIRAMPRILHAQKNVCLLILGKKDRYAESLRQIAVESGVDSALVFTGWLEGNELKSAYAACDVVVVPSVIFDSLPTIALEAMASKKPVVGTSVGGIPEIILDGKTGYIVLPRDVSELSEKIIYLLQHPELAKQFGIDGYQRVVKQFHITRQGDHILDLYNAILKDRFRNNSSKM